MYILLLVGLLLIPVSAAAVYPDSAVILRHEQDQNGSARLWLRFTGDAGEPIVDRAYPVTGTSTMAALRNWVNAVTTELNLSRAAGTAPAVAPGTVITGLAPTPPPPAAETVWRDKVRLYRETCTNGFTGSVTTECNELKTEVETSDLPEYFNVP